MSNYFNIYLSQVYIDSQLKERIAQLAKEEGRPLNSYILRALDQHVKNEEAKKQNAR